MNVNLRMNEVRINSCLVMNNQRSNKDNSEKGFSINQFLTLREMESQCVAKKIYCETLPHYLVSMAYACVW